MAGQSCSAMTAAPTDHVSSLIEIQPMIFGMIAQISS